MVEDSQRPSLEQFQSKCREAFAFLHSFEFREISAEEQRNRFSVAFTNGEYTLTILGENWGLHARATLHDSNGVPAPPGMFVPQSERGRHNQPSTGFSQLDDVARIARDIQTYCVPVFRGDRASFDRVAREWRRITDPEFRRSLQGRKLP